MDTTISYLTFAMAFIALIFQALVAMTGDSGWLNFLMPANISFFRTDILRKGNEYIHGIILNNKGGKLARDILVRIDFTVAKISDIQFDDQAFQVKPSIKEGGLKENHLVINIDRIAPKSQGTIYIATDFHLERPKISVTHDEKGGKEEDYNYSRPLLDKIAIAIGLFALFWIILDPLFR